MYLKQFKLHVQFTKHKPIVSSLSS